MEQTLDHRFAAAVEPHLPALRAYVERRAPSLADDVISEVGEVAWRRIDDVPHGHERAWLFGVARMALLAERRKVAARNAGDAGAGLLDTLSDDSVVSGDLAPPLAEALGALSARDRELLLLTAWEGLSTAETGEALGIRASAVRMGLVRARRRLAALLDELDPGWARRHRAARAAEANKERDLSGASDTPETEEEPREAI